MTEKSSQYRIGTYECIIQDGVVIKGKSTKVYSYGPYSSELVKSTILPKLREAINSGYNFRFPILVTSWILKKGDPNKPLPRPKGKLFVSKVGGLRNLKRIIGIPTQRKRVPLSVKREAIIDAKGQIIELENNEI